MEKFVDRIMETDRKAREMIDAAQAEKKQILENAREKAERQLAEQKAALEQGEREVDAQMAQQAAERDEASDKSYLDAKHKLDSTFDAHRDAWLEEITGHILAAQ